MINLVADIAEALVDYPNEVEVVATEGTQCTILELHVNKRDVGKIIGKQGHTVSAIRTILAAASAK